MYKYNMDLTTIAAALGVPRRKMRAELEREGTSYRKLLRRVRRRMLGNLLEQGKTADCIGYELGYESEDRFFWAFKDMMGVSWTEYHINEAT